MHVCYYGCVRRLAFIFCLVVFVSACGHKRAQVTLPLPGSNSSTPSAEMDGLASYYAEPYHGRKTASGETFDTYEGMTAAHRTLPFNTMVRVTNKANGRQVDVRINDRGPFVDGRVIDLSVRAAREIDMMRAGTVPVKLTVLKQAVSPSSQPFAVQVAALESQSAAEDLKKRLEKKYSNVTVQPFPAEKTLYRVRISEPDMEKANKIVAELRKQNLTPFVVRLN